jgi:hypothetical protein
MNVDVTIVALAVKRLGTGWKTGGVSRKGDTISFVTMFVCNAFTASYPAGVSEVPSGCKRAGT